MSTVFTKAYQDAKDPWTFVASTDTVDRTGDVIEQTGWSLSSFKKNPIALWAHDHRTPIGVWEDIKVEAGRLVARLKIAAPGTSPFIDTLRKLVEQRILRAVSVGFLPSKSEPIKDDAGRTTGYRYIKQELYEISLVSIPANQEALAVARSLPQDLRKSLFAKPGDKDEPDAHGKHAAHSTITHKEGKTVGLAERIKAAQDKVNELRDRLTELSTAEDTSSDAAIAAIDEVSGELEASEKGLATLKRAEAAIAKTVKPADPQAKVKTDAQAKDRSKPADAFFKAGFATFRSIIERRPVDDVIKSMFGEAPDVMVMAKAATAAARTDVPGWAQELVQDQVVGFATLLVPMSIWAAFPGLSLTFGGDGKIILPGRDYSKNVSGGFIGEGGAIPVKAGATRSVALTPDKVAVIIALTRELARRSSPAALPLFQQMVLEDTSMMLDTLFLDNTAATPNVRPAGLQTLATGDNTRIASGATLQNIIADMKDMVGQMGTNRMGRRPVWIMSEANRLALAMLTNDLGQFVFKDEIGRGVFFGYPILSSINVPAGVVFLIDANEIAKAAEGAPMFDVSEQATVHMDTAPNADIAVPASGVVSFFQTDSMGLRMIWELTWGARQNGAVQTLTGVAW